MSCDIGCWFAILPLCLIVRMITAENLGNGGLSEDYSDICSNKPLSNTDDILCGSTDRSQVACLIERVKIDMPDKGYWIARCLFQSTIPDFVNTYDCDVTDKLDVLCATKNKQTYTFATNCSFYFYFCEQLKHCDRDFPRRFQDSNECVDGENLDFCSSRNWFSLANYVHRNTSVYDRVELVPIHFDDFGSVDCSFLDGDPQEGFFALIIIVAIASLIGLSIVIRQLKHFHEKIRLDKDDRLFSLVGDPCTEEKLRDQQDIEIPCHFVRSDVEYRSINRTAEQDSRSYQCLTDVGNIENEHYPSSLACGSKEGVYEQSLRLNEEAPSEVDVPVNSSSPSSSPSDGITPNSLIFKFTYNRPEELL